MKNYRQPFILLNALLFLIFFAYCFNKPNKTILEYEPKKYKIGLLVMATGPYLKCAQRLLKSADHYFCIHHDVHYFVFTDGILKNSTEITRLSQEQMGWPYDSMMRFHTYYKYKENFKDFDYLFACDADMLFVDYVGDEILSDRVATLHPQVRFRRGIYETNPISTACVNRNEGKHYFAGAFYGGKKDEFLTLVETASQNVDIDLARGYIARVNDESHLNRYFATHEPTTILPASYCHFESWRSPYPAKLVALDSSTDSKKGFMRKKVTFNPLDYFKRILKETRD